MKNPKSQTKPQSIPITFKLNRISLISCSYGSDEHISKISDYKNQNSLVGDISALLKFEDNNVVVIVDFHLKGGDNMLYETSVLNEYNVENLDEVISKTPNKKLPPDFRNFLIHTSLNQSRGVQGVTINRPELSEWLLPFINEDEVGRLVTKK